MMTVKKFGSNAIKTVNTQVLVKVFNKHLNVLPNIQFLIYGQLIPLGGFKGDQQNTHQYTLKSMKTQELEEQRIIEKEMLDDTNQTTTSKEQLQQFNQIKKILVNFAFYDKNKKILASEIAINVLAEMRRERKIRMALDDKADDYIQIGLSDIDINDQEQVKTLDLPAQLVIEEKLVFRTNLASAVSITRVNYMLKVLRIVLHKGTIQDPDAYKDKIKRMMRVERARKNLMRQKSGSSFKSMFSKSQNTKNTSELSGTGSDTDGGAH